MTELPATASNALKARFAGVRIDFTLREALATRTYWLVGFAQGMGILVISAVSVHQFAHMEEGVGITRSSAAFVVAVLGVANIAGRLVGGYLGDRYEKRYLAAGGMLGTAIALVILATATSVAQSMVFGVLYGFCWGVRGPMIDSLRGDYFGRANFGKINGTSSLITTPISIMGPHLRRHHGRRLQQLRAELPHPRRGEHYGVRGAVGRATSGGSGACEGGDVTSKPHCERYPRVVA